LAARLSKKEIIQAFLNFKQTMYTRSADGTIVIDNPAFIEVDIAVECDGKTALDRFIEKSKYDLGKLIANKAIAVINAQDTQQALKNRYLRMIKQPYKLLMEREKNLKQAQENKMLPGYLELKDALSKIIIKNILDKLDKVVQDLENGKNVTSATLQQILDVDMRVVAGFEQLYKLIGDFTEENNAKFVQQLKQCVNDLRKQYDNYL
jgi:hypothetical protein